MRFGENVLALNGHPRLFDGHAGNLLAEWPDLVIPPTLGSLITTTARAGSAMVAVDAESPRFAVAQPNRVTVLSHTV